MATVPQSVFKQFCLKHGATCEVNGGELDFHKGFRPRLVAKLPTPKGHQVEIQCFGSRKNISALRYAINAAAALKPDSEDTGGTK